jgi:hypothetical protein
VMATQSVEEPLSYTAIPSAQRESRGGLPDCPAVRATAVLGFPP